MRNSHHDFFKAGPLCAGNLSGQQLKSKKPSNCNKHAFTVVVSCWFLPHAISLSEPAVFSHARYLTSINERTVHCHRLVAHRLQRTLVTYKDSQSWLRVTRRQ